MERVRSACSVGIGLHSRRAESGGGVKHGREEDGKCGDCGHWILRSGGEAAMNHAERIGFYTRNFNNVSGLTDDGTAVSLSTSFLLFSTESTAWVCRWLLQAILGFPGLRRYCPSLAKSFVERAKLAPLRWAVRNGDCLLSWSGEVSAD